MTSTVDIRPIMPAPSPGRVGQGTVVEQSRAVAEVQAAIFVARQFPRDPLAALDAMRDSCKQMALAERAFFEYPRAGATVSGPSVHLARELARIWGNFQYGIVELRRDDEHGQSEMLAFAWDVQTNTRNSNTFINPHKRDTRDGVKLLTDMRDIYESNANHGARRVREAILASLPPWLVEEAKALCMDTLEHGGGTPLPDRIAEALKAFERFGVTQARMEAKFERPLAGWRAADVAKLGVIYESLKQGTVTVDEEFPAADRVTAAEINGNGKPTPPPAAPPAETKRAASTATAGAERPPARLSTGQASIIESHFAKLGFTAADAPEVLNYVILLAGIDISEHAPHEWPISALSDLTQEQGQRVQKQLLGCKNRAALIRLTTSGDKPDGSEGDGQS